MLNEILSRKSVRTFSEQKISDEDLRKILNAGILAPSWVNVQPWHFVVVKDAKLREEINKLCMQQPHVISASDIILVIADVSAWKPENFSKVLAQNPRFKEIIDNIVNSPVYNPSLMSEEIAKLRTIEQCAYAIENMLLEAEHLGISSCIIGACANDFTKVNSEQHEIVKNMLKLKDGMFIFNAIVLGYNADKKITIPRLRKEFDDVVSKDYIGNDL